jgi:hypothetical protein
VPQLRASVVRSEQAVVQAVVPAGQTVLQMPRRHDAVPPGRAVQGRPQAPQFARSVEMLTQTPPQSA